MSLENFVGLWRHQRIVSPDRSVEDRESRFLQRLARVPMRRDFPRVDRLIFSVAFASNSRKSEREDNVAHIPSASMSLREPEGKQKKFAANTIDQFLSRVAV